MERDSQGHEIYVSSMEKSADRKIQDIAQHIKSGNIANIGAGAGAVVERVIDMFPKSRMLALDIDPRMVAKLNDRFSDNPGVEVVKADILHYKFPEKQDTIIFISNIHEIYSSNGYDLAAVRQLLAQVHDSLKPKGRLIIRDGVLPESKTQYLKPLNETSYGLMHDFLAQYRVKNIESKEGEFAKGKFEHHSPRNYSEFAKNDFLVQMNSQGISELLSKYFYDKRNWPAELKEQFGIMTLNEYQELLKKIGFSVKKATTFTLPYLLNTHYRKDFEVYQEKNGILQKTQYPPSTMVLVGEKV